MGASLSAPHDRDPGFRHDPATNGRYLRWWSGTDWGDATRPVGGPTLADVAAGLPTADNRAGVRLGPVTRRAATAVGIGALVVLVGLRMVVVVAADVGIGGSQQAVGWIVLGLGGLVLQAGLVGFVLCGVDYAPGVVVPTGPAGSSSASGSDGSTGAGRPG